MLQNVQIKKNIFSPLIDAFSLARRQLDISAADINSATGKQMCSHWFSYSQWRLPSLIDFNKLCELFRRKADSLGVPCHILLMLIIQNMKSVIAI